jgi:hypothetical protein
MLLALVWIWWVIGEFVGRSFGVGYVVLFGGPLIIIAICAPLERFVEKLETKAVKKKFNYCCYSCGRGWTVEQSIR